MEAVDTTSLRKTIDNLRRALTAYEQHRDSELALMARNSLVMEFEICFGRLRPILERCLISLDGFAPSVVKPMTLGTLIRTAGQRGYTTVDWEHWDTYRKARNETAHAYNESVAAHIVTLVPSFLAAMQGIQDAIHEKEVSSEPRLPATE